MSSIQASKTLLRKEIKSKLSKLSTDEKTRQSDIVYNKLINLPIFKESHRISVYLSTEYEINTFPIIKKIFELNKECFIPRYNGDLMQMVKLNSIQDWINLPVTKWNIKQPDLKEDREDAVETGGLDLIVLPGVSFSKSGARLGHGKGYYDTFLSKLSDMQKKPVTTIGISFLEQLQDAIPTHKHDVILDMILDAS